MQHNGRHSLNEVQIPIGTVAHAEFFRELFGRINIAWAIRTNSV